MRPDQEAAEAAEGRLECLRQIQYSEQSRVIVEALADQKLPVELTLNVLEFLIQTKSPVTEFHPTEPTSTARKAILGDSTASEALEPLFTDALFKMSRLRLSFERWTEQAALAFITSSPRRICSLELSCEALATCCPPASSQRFYPIGLFQAIRVIRALDPSLHPWGHFRSNLRNMQSFRVKLNFKIFVCSQASLQNARWSDCVWRSDGFETTTPHLEVLDLVDAMQCFAMFCKTILTVAKTKTCGAQSINEEMDVRVGDLWGDEGDEEWARIPRILK